MSKIKLIIEIEKRTYELIKDKPDNIAESIIANGTPYNPSGDLISREAVRSKIWKERVEKDEGCNSEYISGLKTAIGFIDNAPPVEPDVETNTEVLIKDAYDHGYTDGWKERFGEPDGRPKGEWIDRMLDKGYVECPFCHKQITGGDLNFCVKYGADMRKGGVE